MTTFPYSISLRVKMIRETEEFLEANLPKPLATPGLEIAQAEPHSNVLEEGEEREDLGTAA